MRHAVSMVLVSCKKCSKEFSAKPSAIAVGNGQYCSKICYTISRKKGENIQCFTCGTKVYKAQKAISTSRHLFCTKACSIAWHNTEFKGQKHRNWKHGMSSYKRSLQRSGIVACCSRCKHADTSVLVAHHVDENRRNNELSNLRWLCRNCHHLVHTYTDEKRLFLLSLI